MKQRLNKLFDTKNKKSKLTGILLGISLIVTTIVLLGIASCATTGEIETGKTPPAAAEPITITLENAPVNAEMFTMIMDYELRNPGIKIEVVFPDSNYMKVEEMEERNMYRSSYIDPLIADLKDGTAPDIIWTDAHTFSEIYSDKYLVDLSEMMENDPKFNKNDYFTSILDAFSYKNRIFGLPLAVEIISPLLAVGEKQLQETGLSLKEGSMYWDDLLSLQGEYKSNQVIPEGYKLTSLSKGELQSEIIQEMLYQFLDFENGNINFDSPDFITFLEQVKSQYGKEEFLFQDYLRDHNSIAGSRIQKENLFFVTIPRLRNGYTEFSPTYRHLNGDKAKIFQPSFSGTVSFKPSSVVSINKKCKNKKAAWDFITFLLTEGALYQPYEGFPVNRKTFARSQVQRINTVLENKDRYSRIYGYEPTRKLLESETELIKGLLERSKEFSYYLMLQPNNVLSSIDRSIQTFFTGEISAKTVAADIQKKLEHLFQEL